MKLLFRYKLFTSPLYITTIATISALLLSGTLTYFLFPLEYFLTNLLITFLTCAPVAYIISSKIVHYCELLSEQKSKLSEQNESLKLEVNCAEKSARTKSEFLSTMSHEIRTPLSAVIGMTHLLLDNNPKLEQIENLKILMFSAENLKVLIDDILDYSKIDLGKVRFEDIDFSLLNLINNTKESLSNKALDNGVQLNAIIDNKLPNCFVGDPHRFGQVLNNLIGNAVKFTKNGTVNIKAGLVEENEEEIKIHFEIEDTGIGIPKDKLKTIFNSFTQAQSSTTRQYGGTGLGLAITQKLLRLMGSEIKVRSELGKGSVFYFDLVFKRSHRTENKLRLNPNNYAKKDLDGINVLLVEDLEINQVVALKFLKKWGIMPDIATNGEDAVKMVSLKDYDIVLMDLQMPIMDGYSATTKIRQLDNPRFKELPIIALTASAMLEEKDRVYKVGMNDFISKPFKPSELYNTISKYTHLFNSKDVAS